MYTKNMIAERNQMQFIDQYIKQQEQQNVFVQLCVTRCAVTLHDANAPQQYIASIEPTPDRLADDCNDDCDDDSIVYAIAATISDAIAKLDAKLRPYVLTP